MNIKMLKVALTSLILAISTFANAGLITMTITDDGTDLTMTAVGNYDNTGLVSQGNIGFGANAAVAGNIPAFGWETTSANFLFQASYSGALTASANALIASSVTTTNPFFFYNFANQIAFKNTAALVGNVNELAVFNGVTLASLGMIAGESISVSWGQNQAIIQTSALRNPAPVPEPSTLAILALGIIGLAARRRNK